MASPDAQISAVHFFRTMLWLNDNILQLKCLKKTDWQTDGQTDDSIMSIVRAAVRSAKMLADVNFKF